jgi:putative hemolysin
MSTLALELAVIFFLLIINGVFSMSEMAVVSARKTRLQHRAEDGDAGARAALDLATNPSNFLSTVQVGITLVGVLAGAFGGAGLSQMLAASLRDVRWIGDYAEPVALGLVVSAITYCSLILGELVPKQIALGNPERIAALVARPMRAIAHAGRPLVLLLTGSTNFVFRLVGIRATADSSVTEQDVRAILEQGAEAGAVDLAEHAIMENTFRLGDRRVSTIMTPRLDIEWIDVDAGAEGLRSLVREARHSPFLVCDGDIERVVGIVQAEDLLAQSLDGQPLDLRTALHEEPLFVPASMPVLRLLETFRSSRRRAAVVLDEFGGVAGLATVDDIVEGLIGELPAPDDVSPPLVARQPDGSWQIDGAVPVADVDAVLDLDLHRHPQANEFDTIGGLVMTVLGRLPVTGDVVHYGGCRIAVERMDGRRVGLVRVRLSQRATRRGGQ